MLESKGADFGGPEFGRRGSTAEGKKNQLLLSVRIAFSFNVDWASGQESGSSRSTRSGSRSGGGGSSRSSDSSSK